MPAFEPERNQRDRLHDANRSEEEDKGREPQVLTDKRKALLRVAADEAR